MSAVFAVAAAWMLLGTAAATVESARLHSEAWYVTTNARLVQAAAVCVGLLWLPGVFRLRGRERDAHVVRRTPTGA